MKSIFLLSVLALILRPLLVRAAFGYTDDGSNYVINTGANLVFKVSKSNGDINSMVYRGTEYEGYDGKHSHVQSGLGGSTVTISSTSSVIKVTVTYLTLIHTIIARTGVDNIFLLTNKVDASVDALRFVVRLKPGFPVSTTLPDHYDTGGTVIEAGDITQNSLGYTKSKHYAGLNYGRTIDYDYVGKTTGSVAIWLSRSNHEKASGGPFFRSLLRGSTDTNLDLYEIFYYAMGTTDPERYGLQGPYVISFTTGGSPDSAYFAKNADWSWIDSLGITGWVPASGRGRVVGVGTANMKSGYTYTVGISNSAAQYWTTAPSSGGSWTISKVLPGTYTLTLYKGEYEVATKSSVVVTANTGTSINTLTAVDPSDSTAIFRIGDWDGTPAGFRNFDTTPYPPTYMHPSDPRLASWAPGTYIVGTHTASRFPGYMWKEVNNNQVINFKLTAAQAAASHVLRIGITQAYAGGRPQIKVNSWTSSSPAASTQASTRSMTVGTYRGNNAMFTYTIPASAFLTDVSQYNVLTITVISGSSGVTYLSPGYALDCIDLLA